MTSYADLDPDVATPVLGLLGDSRTANTTYNLAGALRSEGNGLGFWAETLSRCRVRLDHDCNFGVGGYKTSQVYDRVNEAIASPANVFVVLCSVNDTTFAEPSLATRLTNLTKIADRLSDGGKVVIMVAELPFSSSITTTKANEHLRIRQHLLSLTNIPRVYVADPFPNLVDPTSSTMAPISGLLYDGLHQSPQGAYWIGKKVADILSTLYPEPAILPCSNADLYHAAENVTGCLNANPMMAGTGGTLAGTSTGSVATSWTSNNAQLAMACSKVTANGKDWQQVAISGSPAASANAQLQQALTFSQFAVGDVVEAVCEVEVDAGTANLYPLHLSLSTGGVVESVRAGYGGTSPEYGFTTGEAWSGVLRTPRLTIKAGMTSCMATLNVIGKSGSGATAMTYRVRAWSVRKVV